jgi:hypothetical protein
MNKTLILNPPLKGCFIKRAPFSKKSHPNERWLSEIHMEEKQMNQTTFLF